MLYTKSIQEITYQDVVDFCQQNYRENVYLDYKRQPEAGLAKTISAMANTWGGLIIVGIDEEDSKPKLPFVGIEYTEHIREQINNIILGNISPPIFPEIQVCEPKDGKTFIIIRISQSSITPHAIKNNTKVYLRTDTSNEPEELANLERVSWLVDRRQKSVDLKENFLINAQERYGNCCAKEKFDGIPFAENTLSISPAFPYEILKNAPILRNAIINEIRVGGWNGNKVPTQNYAGEYHSVQQGIYNFVHNSETKYTSYTELNEYGFYFSKFDLGNTDKQSDGSIRHSCFFGEILSHLDLFLESSRKLYTALGYWGTLEFKFCLDKITSDVNFVGLPAPQGTSYRGRHPASSSIDMAVKFTRLFSLTDLNGNKDKIVCDLFMEIAWSLDYHVLERELLEKIIQENRRYH